MYNLQIINDVELQAESIVEKDRLVYKKFIEEGERVAAKLGMIVSGDAAKRLLLADIDSTIGLDSYTYNFLSTHAVSHARALADAMHDLDPDGIGHYVAVLTDVPNYMFRIIVNSRTLFTIVSIQNIIPDKHPATFTKIELLCVGPEIQLIDTYYALTNPEKVKTWKALLVAESGLREKFIKNTKEKFNTMLGGGEHRPPTNLLIDAIRTKYITGPGRVLIGPAAVECLTSGNLSNQRKFDVITSSSLETDIQEINALAKRVGAEISWKIDDPRLPSEPRLRRMTVHVTSRDRKDLVLNIYNSAAYDTIPYTEVGNICCGTPFVIMLYILIDIWIILTIHSMSVITTDYAKSILTKQLNTYELISEYYDQVLGSIDKIFPKTFIGRIENFELSLKRSAVKSGKVYFPYIPRGRA